jgi:transketolase C-terminal domain/subunit
VSKDAYGFEIEKAILMHLSKINDNYVCIISTGIMTAHSLTVANELISQGIKCSVLILQTIKPLDIKFIFEQARGNKKNCNH